MIWSSRQEALQQRFPPRPKLTDEELWAELFQDCSKVCVLECLIFLATEYRIDPGFLRPEDRLSVLFAPVKTLNPLKWLIYRGRESDGQTEIKFQLQKRLTADPKKRSLEHIETFGQFVRAWCGC